MKSIADEAMDTIARGDAIETSAVEILCDPPVRVWSGPWPIDIEGNEYLGIGDRGLVKDEGAALGGAAQKLSLELSGIDPAHLELLDADEVRGAAVIVRRMLWDGSGTRLLDVHVLRRGRIDQVATEEVVGGLAVIRAAVEGAARGLGRRGARMRSDADQRLIEANDGGMRRLAYAGQKQLYWGGKPPTRAGSGIPGAGGGGGIGAYERMVMQ